MYALERLKLFPFRKVADLFHLTSLMMQCIIFIYILISLVYSTLGITCLYGGPGSLYDQTAINNVSSLTFSANGRVISLTKEWTLHRTREDLFHYESKYFSMDCVDNPHRTSKQMSMSFSKNGSWSKDVHNGLESRSKDCLISIKNQDCNINYPIIIPFSFILLILSTGFLGFYIILSILSKNGSINSRKAIRSLYLMLKMEVPVDFQFCYKDGGTFICSPGKDTVLMKTKKFPGKKTSGDFKCSYKGYDYVYFEDSLLRVSKSMCVEKVGSELSPRQKINLFDCFWYLNNLGYPCVDGSHCLNPVEIHKAIRSKNYFKVSKAKKEEFLDPELNYSAIYNLFKNDYSEKMMTRLVLHNSDFFNKGEGNFSALLRVMRGQTFFNQRPNGVNNSQWKLYVSDVNYILGNLGYGVKSYEVRRPTKACLDHIDSEVKIEPVNREISVHLSINPLDGKQDDGDREQVDRFEVSLDINNLENVKRRIEANLSPIRPSKKENEGCHITPLEELKKYLISECKEIVKTHEMHTEEIKEKLKPFFDDKVEEMRSAIALYNDYRNVEVYGFGIEKIRDSLIDFTNDFDFDENDKLSEFEHFDSFARYKLYTDIMNCKISEAGEEIDKLDLKLKGLPMEQLNYTRIVRNQIVGNICNIEMPMTDLAIKANEINKLKSNTQKDSAKKATLPTPSLEDTSKFNQNRLINGLFKFYSKSGEELETRDVVPNDKKAVRRNRREDSRQPFISPGKKIGVRECISEIKQKKKQRLMKKSCSTGTKDNSSNVKKNNVSTVKILKPTFPVPKASFEIVEIGVSIPALLSLYKNKVFLGKKNIGKILGTKVKSGLKKHLIRLGKNLNPTNRKKGGMKGKKQVPQKGKKERENLCRIHCPKLMLMFINSVINMETLNDIVEKFLKLDLNLDL